MYDIDPASSSREFLARDHLRETGRHLSLRQASQGELSSFESDRQNGACGGRIEANGSAHLRVPKVRAVQWSRPRALDQTHKAVLTLLRHLVPAALQHQHRGIAGDGGRGGAACESRLCANTSFEILGERRHVLIAGTGCLGVDPLASAKGHGEYEAVEHCSDRSGGTIRAAPSLIRGWSGLVVVGVHHAPVFSWSASKSRGSPNGANLVRNGPS